MLLDAKIGVVDIANHNGATALLMASASGHVATVELLLRRGAGINAASLKGTTALISAANSGQTDVVKLLLANDADRHAQDSRGKTALLCAEQQCHSEVVGVLRQPRARRPSEETESGASDTSGSSITQDEDEKPAGLGLNPAATTRASAWPTGGGRKKAKRRPGAAAAAAAIGSEWSNLRLGQLRQLLAAFQQPSDGPKPLLEARLALHLAGADSLSSPRKPASSPERRRKRHKTNGPSPRQAGTAGSSASGVDNDDEDVKIVGEVTADQKRAAGQEGAIDLEGQFFLSDLFTGCREGNTAKLMESLEAGVAIDQADNDGKTALMCAAEAGQARSVRILLQEGAGVDPVDRDGWSALMYAALANSSPCVTLLGGAGAGLEVVDREFGTTAFLIACEHGCASSVSALAAAGANIRALDSNRATGGMLAAGEKPPHEYVLKLLENFVCEVCDDTCAKESALLPSGMMLCLSCFEAQKQGPEAEQVECRAASRCAGGMPLLSATGAPLPAASPRKDRAASGLHHAGSLEVLLDHLEQLERAQWPPKRPRSSFIYFSAASREAIQQHIQEEQAAQQQKEEKQRMADHGDDMAPDLAAAPAMAAAGSGKERKAAAGGQHKNRFAQLLSQSWQRLGAEERKLYESLAATDNERHAEERAVWAKGHQQAWDAKQQEMWQSAAAGRGRQQPLEPEGVTHSALPKPPAADPPSTLVLAPAPAPAAATVTGETPQSQVQIKTEPGQLPPPLLDLECSGGGGAWMEEGPMPMALRFTSASGSGSSSGIGSRSIRDSSRLLSAAFTAAAAGDEPRPHWSHPARPGPADKRSWVYR